MNATYWNVAGWIAFVVLWIFAAWRSERAALRRRCKRLVSRRPLTIDDWQREMPSVRFDTLAETLTVIGTALEVPYQSLYPTDAFDDELKLADRFLCLFIDDDISRELIADAFETRYSRRPSGHWNDLRDVVLETCSIVENSG